MIYWPLGSFEKQGVSFMGFIQSNAWEAFFVATCLLLAVVGALFGVRALTWLRNSRDKRDRACLRDATDQFLNTDDGMLPQSTIRRVKRTFFTKRGVARLTDVVVKLEGEQRFVVAQMMTRLDFGAFLQTQLTARNEKYLALVLRLIGLLRIGGDDEKIKAALYEHKDNLDIQYLALLALSQRGSKELLVFLSNDPNFISKLSYRSLAEILKSYAGDKKELYQHMLNAASAFSRRLAIKRIGAENLQSFAPKVHELYRNSDASLDLRIDAIRTLGKLRYESAHADIIAALSDSDWRVRNVAYVALWDLRGEDACDMLLTGLTDPQWWVRFNSAKMLAECEGAERLAPQVAALNDAFAREAFASAVNKRKLERGARS